MRDNFNVHEWRIDQIRKENQSVFDAISIKDLALEIANDIKPWLADDVNPSQPDLQMTIQAILGQLQYKKLNEGEDFLEKLSSKLSKENPNLRFDVNQLFDRIDIRGRGNGEWGDKNQGKVYGEYEVFYVDDDDRGDVVRIVKSDEILRGK